MQTIKVKNIAELRARKGSTETSVDLSGYYVEGDGGGGSFYWNPTSTTTDDGGVTIAVSGVSTGRWVRNFQERVSVKWFGAKGDGVFNDTTSIQNCSSFIVTNDKNKYLYFPNTDYFYNTTSSISIASGINVIMEGIIKYTGTSNVAILIIGSNSTNNSKVNLKLAVTRNITDWTNDSSVGITLYNCINSNIEIVESSNSTIGVKCLGDSTRGFAYNRLILGEISGNKIGIDLCSNASGYVNENSFYGGRFTCYTGQGSGLERIGVRITSLDSSYTNNNNNIFYKPCFELKSTEASPNLATPISIVHGNLNQFLDVRNEFNSPNVAYIYNESSENKITQAYGTGSIVDASIYPNNVNEQSRNLQLNTTLNLLYSSGKLVDRVKYYDGTTSFLQIQGVNLPSSSSSATNVANSFTSITDSYIEFSPSRGVGVFVDTDVVKNFIVKPSYESGAGARVMIRCYDASGTILTTGDLVKGASTNPFSYNSSFGGVWRTGANSETQIFFNVDSTVKKVCVIFASVTTNMKIKSFAIFTPEKFYNTQVYPGYTENISSGNGVTAAPSTGTWTRGTVLFNVTPSAGGNTGWICVTAGTPGTWKEFGTIEKRKKGSSVQSGNGILTSFTIAHGLGSTPTFINVQSGSANAQSISYITADATNITVNFDIAPLTGTNNLTFYWEVSI